MITLRTLGGIGLTAEDGRDLDGLLAQPKRLALLVYLASPQPGTWHRRDTLVGVFWPELESGKARTALRNALYVLRQELGAEVLRTRGDDEVSLDPALLQSDTGRVRLDIDAGRWADACARHQGDFLPGLFIRGAPEFERWLEEERGRLRAAAVQAARRLSLEREAAGDVAGAAAVQQRVTEIEPLDEAAVRRLMLLLDGTGNRGQALAAFDRLDARLRNEFGAGPSAETLRLAQDLRSRRSAVAPVAGAPRAPSSDRHPAGPASPDPVAAVVSAEPRIRRHRWWLAAAMAAAVLVPTVVISRTGSSAGAATATLLVLPMVNGTGDTAADYIASGLADDVARRLSAMRSLTVRASPRADWPARVRDSLKLIGSEFRAGMVLRSRLTTVGDSLEVEAEVVDAATGAVKDATSLRFAPATVRDAGSRLVAAIAGGLLRVPLPEVPRAAAAPVDPEAHRLTMLGWHELLRRDDVEAARRLFLRATQADPSYARAWSGLSSTWSAATVNGLIPFEEGFTRAAAAAERAVTLDSLEGSAWANLGILHALRARSLTAGEPYFERALAAEPANPEIHMVLSSALRHAHDWDRARDAARIARRLDPLSALYAEREANGAMCEGRAEEALALYRNQVELDPWSRSGHLGVARALARLGRWDEAIAQLRALARARGDTALAADLATARGAAGYWALKHREGRMLLDAREARAGESWVAPYILGVAEIGAGHVERGMARLEAEVRAGSRMVYKLPCNPEIDEVRDTPRYRRLLEAAGALRRN